MIKLILSFIEINSIAVNVDEKLLCDYVLCVNTVNAEMFCCMFGFGGCAPTNVCDTWHTTCPTKLSCWMHLRNKLLASFDVLHKHRKIGFRLLLFPSGACFQKALASLSSADRTVDENKTLLNVEAFVEICDCFHFPAQR